MKMTKMKRRKKSQRGRDCCLLLKTRWIIQGKNAASQLYDTSDPFIDDPELVVGERQYIAQTKQQSFYVFSGEVALGLQE